MVTESAYGFDCLSQRKKAYCRKQLKPQSSPGSQDSRWKILGLVILVLIPHRVVGYRKYSFLPLQEQVWR